MALLVPGSRLPDGESIRRIGPGLHADAQDIAAIRAGILYSSAKSSFLDSSFKRYSPAQSDSVIGQVTARFAEGYRVDLGSAIPAQLDALAFYNVNRKNKPNLTIGALVYARITSQIQGVESEIQCLTTENKAGGYGALEGGYLLKDQSLGLCRRLLSPEDVTLNIIGEKVEYEIVVGMNGRLWIDAEDKKVVIVIASILRGVEFLSEGEARLFIAKTFQEAGL